VSPARDDPGLAAYRTRLSWRRTALSVTVVAVLTVRLALADGTVGALVAAVAVGCWLGAVALSAPMAGGRTVTDRPATAPLVALAVAGYAVSGLVLVLTR
jgi:uncharacterized membrane protein YidH (DUF202 family)